MYSYIYFCIYNISSWESKYPTEKSWGGVVVGNGLIELPMQIMLHYHYSLLSLKAKKKKKKIDYFMVALIRYF